MDPISYDKDGNPLTTDGRKMSQKGINGIKFLNPVRDKNDPRFIKLAEGRQRANIRKKAQKEQRMKYQEQLTEIRATSLEKAKDRLDTGEDQDPLEIIQDIIKQQLITVNDPAADPRQLRSEKELLLKATMQLTDLLGAKPGTNVDAENEVEEEQTVDEVEAELRKTTKALRIVK